MNLLQLASVVVFAVGATLSGSAQERGVGQTSPQHGVGPSVSGCVTAAPDGSPLAGAEVELSDEGGRQRAATDGEGRFRFRLPQPGRVSLVVRLQGFDEVLRSDVLVGPDGAREDFRLEVAPVETVIWREPRGGLRAVIREATLVAHVRITGVGPTSVRSIQGLRVPARLCDAIVLARRLRGARPEAERISLLQYSVGEPPYVVGQEFVLFLRRDAGLGAFLRVAGPAYAVPVHDGVAAPQWPGARPQDSVAVSEFLRRLASLETKRRPD